MLCRNFTDLTQECCSIDLRMSSYTELVIARILSTCVRTWEGDTKTCARTSEQLS